MRGAALLAAFAAAGPPGHAEHPGGTRVSVAFGAYDPPQVQVLAGDTVTWTNDSVRQHTVTAFSGAFASPRVFSGDSFVHRFQKPGQVAYYCTVHSFMRGEVDVERLLLDDPAGVAAPRRPFPLAGRAALDPGTPVRIEADAGQGFRPVATATVGAFGRFTATVAPETSARYRAVADESASPPVQLRVEDRAVSARIARRGRRVTVTARVLPAAPGAPVQLQFRQREHFGWWPVRNARLDRSSRARFVVRTRRPVHARVLLTLPDRATILASSPGLRASRDAARPPCESHVPGDRLQRQGETAPGRTRPRCSRRSARS